VVSYGKKGREYFQYLKTISAFGDGNVLTTVGDLALWDENFYTGKVGGDALLKLQKTKGVLSDGKLTDYGFGLEYGQFAGNPVVMHGGAYLGFRTELLRFPSLHLSIIVLCNLDSMNATALAQRVATIFLPAVFLPAKAATSVTAIPPTTPKEIQVNLSRFDAYLDNHGLAETPGLKQQILPAQSDLVAPSGERETHRAQPFAGPTEAGLGEYVGTYYSEELDLTYFLTIENKRLVAKISGEPEFHAFPLVPSSSDSFGFMAGHLYFLRNPDAHIQSMNYSEPRASNVVFTRERGK
jgi:hypothetical protein